MLSFNNFSARIFSILLLFISFGLFADYSVNFTYTLTQNNDSWVSTGLNCPSTAFRITRTSGYEGNIGLMRRSDNHIIDLSNYSIDLSVYYPQFYVRQVDSFGSPITITWYVDCTGDDPEIGGGDPVDPENPGGGGGDDSSDPGGSGSGDQPWALESSLQTYISNFRTFSQAYAIWASSLLGDVRAGNQTADGVLRVLTGINSQQINDHEQRNNLHDDMKIFLGPLRDNVSGIKSGIDDLKIKGSQSLTAQNLGNSYLASIEGYQSQISGKTTSMDNKLSTANTNLSSINDSASAIKNTLNPQGVTSPTAPTPISSLPSGSSFIQTVKSRLLPGYSFFSPSGDSWPSWTVTFPLSVFGMEDLTVVLGGSDWQTVAGGKIVWLASIIRSLSKFAFYLIFLNAVIKSLRQW